MCGAGPRKLSVITRVRKAGFLYSYINYLGITIVFKTGKLIKSGQNQCTL